MFGILVLILKDKLHIEILRTWGARVVGITLLTIGVVGIKEAQDAASSIPLLLAGNNANDLYSASSSSGSMRKNVGFATFATGIVHGLQPDALIMILPALALPSRLAGAAFLGMFLLGTVLAMSGYTVFLGSCSQALQKRIPRITEHLSWISSSVAILVGMAILAGELFGLSIL
jgi:sulfite exporter TauE/SafE